MNNFGKKLMFGIMLSAVLMSTGGILVAPLTARAQENAKCVIKEASFATSQKNVNNPTGAEIEQWYADSARPLVKIVVRSENCVGKTIKISLLDEDALGDDALNTSNLDNRSINDIPSNDFAIKLVAGEEECETGSTPNCNLYFEIDENDDVGPVNKFTTENKPGGMLRYDCDGLCYENWTFTGLEKLEDGAVLQNDPSLGEAVSGYVLLAPLPGLENIDTETTGLGDYLNKIFIVIIGLAGLLAVLMLVVHGIHYMGTESIFGKGEAKAGIGNAIFGLLLALGAVVILTTINPDLINLNLRVDRVSISIDDMPMVVGAPGSQLGDYKVGDPWVPAGTNPSEQDARNQLAAQGIVVTSSGGTTCTEVGQPACTSVGGLPNHVLEKIIKLKQACCASSSLTVTGGTEYWHHKTHGLNKTIVDFSVTDDLNKFITGSKQFPHNCTELYNVSKNNISFSALAETNTGSKKCSWSPAPHWHIVFQ